MIKNDLAHDVRYLMQAENVTQMKAAADLGVHQPSLARTIREGLPENLSWFKLVDYLGYDIEIVFHKRA